MTKRITSWSYSRWADYDKCPQLAKFKHVDKLKEPENPAMANGTRVHDELAEYLGIAETPRNVPVPKSGERFADLLAQLRTLEPIHDQEWGFTRSWRTTGWFARDTWFRSKLDVCAVYDDNTADVVDFKTGKPSDSHAAQAELYAVSVFLRYANVTDIIVRFWYLDTGAESIFAFTRREMKEMITEWEKRVEPMLNDEIFAPRPGNHCRWCFFAKSNNGPCKFG
jgi:RecB family exonuclease